MTLNKFNACL